MMDQYYTPEAKSERRQYINLQFQSGSVQESGINGCHIEDVIDVLVERLRGFQAGDLRCRENALMITHLEEAGNWGMKRRMNRLEQSVEGTYQPHKEQ